MLENSGIRWGDKTGTHPTTYCSYVYCTKKIEKYKSEYCDVVYQMVYISPEYSWGRAGHPYGE